MMETKAKRHEAGEEGMERLPESLTTVQIIGIAVASVIVLLLIVALIVSRRRSHAEESRSDTAASFLDEAPQDTLARLGRPDQPVEDVTIDPGAARAAAASPAVDAGGLGLDWGPGPDPLPMPSGAGLPTVEAAAAEGSSTVPRPAPAAEPPGAGGSPYDALDEAPAAEPDQVAPTAPDEAGITGGPPAAGHTPDASEASRPRSSSGDRMVPLSEIIVTTSHKLVDLEDPEVRRMLTDLVTFEIDQAAEFRRQGQTIDAVLQLTEAEKVSRALGMRESADRIRSMMEEIKRG